MCAATLLSTCLLYRRAAIKRLRCATPNRGLHEPGNVPGDAECPLHRPLGLHAERLLQRAIVNLRAHRLGDRVVVLSELAGRQATLDFLHGLLLIPRERSSRGL